MAAPQLVPDPPPSPDGPPDVLGATRAELDRLGAVDSVLGCLLLVLAHRMDAGGDSGSGLAALSREYRSLFDKVTGMYALKGDPLDELRRRASRRRAAQPPRESS